jgi:hypothetical protein
MAIIDITTGIIRGKLGNIVFCERMGTNYARKYVKNPNKPSAKQEAHRRLYAQLQGLGSIWLRDLIKPYFQGDPLMVSAYRQFIKYNWRHWDKIVPAWKIALPFWGYGEAAMMAINPDMVSGNVTVDLFPPAGVSLSACSPHFLQILKSDLNFVHVPDYETLPDRHRVTLADCAGYVSGAWNMLVWYNDQADITPITDPARG